MTVGKGSPESWYSCSHGAGRAMSRTRAKATIKQARAALQCRLTPPRWAGVPMAGGQALRPLVVHG